MKIENINFKYIGIGELGALVSEVFKKHDMEAILVGGSCVSIYTENKYESYDLDFISYETQKKIKVALAEINFSYDSKKYYVHNDCPYFIEFLSPPVAVGNEPINKFQKRQESTGVLTLLTPTDCVKDRLASFFYWNDVQALEQAVLVAKEQKVSLSAIQKWAREENQVEKYKKFIDILRKET